MKKQNELSSIVQSILLTHFQITETTFDWDTPLHLLDADFKLYATMEDLQRLLSEAIGRTVVLVERINGMVHTPQDVVNYLETIKVSYLG